MALMVPRFYFVNESNSFGNTVDTTPGVSVTLGASNSDGSAVTLLSALSHDVHYLMLKFMGQDAPAGQNPCNMVDILQDPAGGTSWASFIDDLIIGLIANPNPSNIPPTAGFLFPVYIKSGTSLGIQGRTAHSATRPVNCLCWAFGNPSRPDQWWCGAKVETLGATPAGSRGTTVTPGTSGSYGSWTNIGSTISGRYGCIQPGYNGKNTTTMIIQSNKLRIGYGSNKLPGSPVWFLGGDDSERAITDVNAFPLWCDIPAGTQMQVSIAANVASSPDALEIALYGVY